MTINEPWRGSGDDRIRVLYLVYWGAAEPLGQSLVLPTVERLATRGARVCLVTFEKSQDLASPARMTAVRTRLEAHGVDWHPLRYHKTPRVPATAFDIAAGWARAVTLGRRMHAQVVHGRTFIGALSGRAVATALKAPFVYHAEGFYPEEMADAGLWSRTSLSYRVARALDARLFANADGVIVLSHRAAGVLQDHGPLRRKDTPVTVVPSCVDLDRFSRIRGLRAVGGGPLRLVYSGGVGGRYPLDRMGRFVAILAESTPVRLQVLTREPAQVVAAMLRRAGLPDDQWQAGLVPHAAIAGELLTHDAALSFLVRGASEVACSPTKVGEYWACGLPIVTTPEIGDIDGVIERFRCGVIVPEHTDDAYRRAGRNLLQLLADPGLGARCRAAAEAHYALDPACERQMELYRLLTASGRATA